MKTVGLICEFNPLHRGHARLLSMLKREFDSVVCVMSGSFVQRGECAAFDKYVRAEAAIACGADVVLELPVTRVLQSAEGFASGGVELLRRLGCVDALAFGCESGGGTRIWRVAKAMNAPEYERALREKLAEGISYAAAKQAALSEGGELLRAPNDILAVEYCRAIQRQNAPFSVFSVKRAGDYHATAPDPENPSAEAIRALLAQGGDWLPYLPEEARALFAAARQYAMRCGERAMLARLRAMNEAEWEACAHGSEGLWRKVRAAVHSCATTEEILLAAKSKRYPMTRLKRLLLCAYLGVSAEDLSRPIADCRILACSEQGRSILRAARDCGEITLRNPGERMENAELDRRCGDLFALFAASDAALVPGMEQKKRIKIGNP